MNCHGYSSYCTEMHWGYTANNFYCIILVLSESRKPLSDQSDHWAPRLMVSAWCVRTRFKMVRVRTLGELSRTYGISHMCKLPGME